MTWCNLFLFLKQSSKKFKRLRNILQINSSEFFSDIKLHNTATLVPFFHLPFTFKTASSILHFIDLSHAKPSLTMEDEFCKKVDLNLTININLLADAPQGHPRLLNVKRPQKNPIAPKIEKHKSRRIEFPEGLSLVDVLVTILFDWKPAALHHLLNVEDEQFYCAAKLERTLRYESWDRFIVNRLASMFEL